MNDQDIVRRIRASQLKDSELVLKEVYESCYHICEQMIVANSGTREDAKDIFQDAMVVFYNKAKSEDFVLSSKISTYLFAVSKNLWLKKLRTASKYSDVSEEYMDTLEGGIEIVDESQYSTSSQMLANLLEKSGEKCLGLLKMFYYERLKMKEISSELGFASEQVAKNQKVRCLKKIRAVISQYPHYKELLSNYQA